MEMEKINPNIENSWKEVLINEFNSEYFTELKSFLIAEKRNNTIYPPGPLIFNAFNLTPFDKIKVVIIGQDPYHGPNQAHGLCFSVQDGVGFPPSLINIFKELKSDIGCDIPKSGNLEKWAKQGVLLLNATLTVRASQAGSHQKKGWERFTDVAIRNISDNLSGIIFLLWGNFAKQKEKIIDESKHYILTCGHPSPMSANQGLWFGNKHFSKANEILQSINKQPINWDLT